MAATLAIAGPSTYYQDAFLPETLAYEDPTGRVVMALAAENVGTLPRTRTGSVRVPFDRNGNPTSRDAKWRDMAIQSRWYEVTRHYWNSSDLPAYVCHDPSKQRADRYEGERFVQTWTGIDTDWDIDIERFTDGQEG